MVIDLLENSAKIEGMHPLFKKIFDYVKSHDLSGNAPGRIEIAGDDAYINVAELKGKDKNAAKLETHNQYIDVQILLKGEESFGWKSRGALACGGAYSENDDISFYEDEANLYFTLSAGEFVVFFPEDGHAPGIGQGDIKKLIAKVRV